MAETGAHASDMLQQARDLVRKIRENDGIDFYNDWKLVTMYIGANDICQLPCINDTDGEPQVLIQNIKSGLDYLRDNLPRTFVNAVPLSNIPETARTIVTSSTIGPVCESFYEGTCPCVYGEMSIGERLDIILIQYQQNLQALVESGRYDGFDNFTVVLQPFSQSVQLYVVNNLVDTSSFAVDCTHFSAKGNREFAIGLWNNMLEKVGGKSTRLELQPMIKINCPTDEEPFLFTAKNSRKLLVGQG